MAWTAPMTAAANDIWTSAQFNTHVRDNLLETAPAKATTAGQLFTASGTNAISAWSIQTATVATSETLAVTGSAQDLATVGPSVTVTVGANDNFTVLFSAQAEHSSANTSAGFGVEVSGGTSIPLGSYESGVWLDGTPVAQANRMSGVQRFHANQLGTGSHTFKLRYFITSATATYSNRSITVLPF